MPKSGGIDWVLLGVVAAILVLAGVSIWALLRFRRSRKEPSSAPVEGTVMWPRGRAGELAGLKPAPPPQAPEAPEAPEGTVMWPKGRAARAAARVPAPSAPPAPEATLAEPERKGSFFGALIRKWFPPKQPAPQTFSETVMFPRERGSRTAPEPRAPSFQPPGPPPRVDPGGFGTPPAPAPKEDPGWARRLPPAPPRAVEASQPPEASPQAPGLSLQDEVELLRRQLRELQAQQDNASSQPAPPQAPPGSPRRLP